MFSVACVVAELKELKGLDVSKMSDLEKHCVQGRWDRILGNPLCPAAYIELGEFNMAVQVLNLQISWKRDSIAG